MSERLKELESLLIDPARRPERDAMTVGDWSAAVNEYVALRDAADKEQGMYDSVFGNKARILFGEESAPGSGPPAARPADFTFGLSASPVSLDPAAHGRQRFVFGGNEASGAAFTAGGKEEEQGGDAK